jgi:uncharacterized protein YbaP (TraB family)
MKLNPIFRLLIGVILLSACSSTKKAATKETAIDNHLFWEISGNGLKSPSYLYGTFHMLCEEDIVFVPAVQEAMSSVEAAYFEIDMDDPGISMKMLANIKMNGDMTLKDLLSEQAYQKVETYFKDSAKTSLKSMEKYKPFMLLSLLYPKMMPCKKLAGVDEKLVKIAKSHKKSIEGLESVEFQTSVFDSIPYQVQADELVKAIDNMDKSKLEMKKMMEAYKNKRLDQLVELTENDQLMAGSMDILLNQRNSKWIKELRLIMPEKSVFVAVGAGHLPGEKGLLRLLRQEGYTLKPVD